MENNRQVILDLISQGFDISNGHIKIKRSKTAQENWIVRWEDYFNPHANPKSLYSEKSFEDINKAVDFFISKIGESFEEK